MRHITVKKLDSELNLQFLTCVRGNLKWFLKETLEKKGEFSLVEVIWHGHACFELRGKKASVVIDPFEGLGIPEPEANAEIVLCSHSHRDHNNFAPVLKNGGTVLEGFVGSREVSGVSIKGTATFHDVVGGGQRGNNSIYVVHLDDVRFCHLGDLGHDLNKEHIAEIGEIDVLLTPVGGGPTIGPKIASSIVEKMDPRIVVPMHYNAEVPGQKDWMNTRLHKVDTFLSSVEGVVERLDSRSFTITKENISKSREIKVLTLT